MYLSPQKMKRRINWYPPYWGTGIWVTEISEDWRKMTVCMKLHWYNRNAVGCHFGGSLYSMVDPHFMLMLMQLLGRDYVVWDKSAKIEYVKAVKSRVWARFEIDDELLATIRQKTATGEKFLPRFGVVIMDDQGQLVARVEKELYIRLKAARQ